jgi:sugar/nucleoside kinase (ribokinase family)
VRPLVVIGNVNIDLIMGPVRPWPAVGTESLVEYYEMRAGGAAGNVALAWRDLDVPFQIAASVGRDPFGLFLKEAFPGVSDHWPVADAKTTISLGLTHPDGERTFLTTEGHLSVFTVESALSCIEGERMRGGLLLLCGSFVMPRLVEAYDDLFSWARRHAVDIAPTPAGLREAGARRQSQGRRAGCRTVTISCSMK